MLARSAVDGIVAALRERASDSHEALLTPQLEIIYEYAPKNGPKALDFNLIHESVWRHWDGDRHLPVRVGLAEFLDLVTATAAQWLPQHQQGPQFTVIGFTLMYDEPLTVPTDHVPGDGFIVPAPTRVLVAVDVDGRSYQLMRGVGPMAAFVQVDAPVTPPLGPVRDPGIHDRQATLSALAQLVAVVPRTQPDDGAEEVGGGAEEVGSDELVLGELVTVVGDRWDDDERNQLWVVVDNFFDYTIAVLGGNGYHWAKIPRGELTPVAPEWIRRVIRGDRTYGYVGADSIEPVLLEDEFFRRELGYELTRVYRLAGQVLRVRVHRQAEPEQSRAEAQVLNPTGGFTLIAATPPADWHAATPPTADSGAPLHPIAGQLLRRAVRILTPPADPTTKRAGS